MALNFTTTSEAARNQGVKCLGYGRAGMGKTRMCATAPNPVIISAEAGLLSIAEHNIPVITINTVEDIVDAHIWCRDSVESNQFWTVCIDSVTEIGEKVLANAKKQCKDPRQAYGELIDKMLETIKEFRDLKNKHVFMTAKEERLADAATGRVLYGPSMPGSKLGPGLPYYFDEVFHLEVDTTPEGVKHHYVRTQSDWNCDAKDRSGKLDMIEPPDLNHIFNKIMAGM